MKWSQIHKLTTILIIGIDIIKSVRHQSVSFEFQPNSHRESRNGLIGIHIRHRSPHLTPSREC